MAGGGSSWVDVCLMIGKSIVEFLRYAVDVDDEGGRLDGE